MVGTAGLVTPAPEGVEAPRAPGHLPHRKDIQGLRGLAVLLVVLYHARLGFSGGFVGVDVFFVISGFVITGLLTGELRPTGSLSLARFYVRRIRRLAPALGLLVVVIALLAIVAAPLGAQPIAARTGASASVFVANFYLYLSPEGYFGLDSHLNPFLHTWSLAVEEQFYLVFPLLLLGAWRLGRRAGRPVGAAAGVLGLVTVASFALSVAMVRGTSVLPGIDDPRAFAFFSSITRAWEFGAGVLLALGATRLRRLPAPLGAVLGWVGVAMIVAVSLRYDDLTPFPGVNAIPPVLGTVLILGAGIGGLHGPGRALSLRPAVFIGDLSYSWYLWHWPLIVFARAIWPGSFAAPIAAAVSLLPAWCSYRFVENPIRFNERLTPLRTLAMGAGVVLLAFIACGVLIRANVLVEGSDGFRSVERALRTHRACPVRGSGMRGRQARDPEIAVRCTWDVADSSGVVALLGDSNAGHLVEPVVEAGRAAGRDVYVGTSNGCPFVDVTMVVAGERRADCRHFYEGSMHAVERMRPSIVVLGSTTTRYLDEAEFGIVVGTTGPTASTPDEKARAWREGLHRTSERLAELGVSTLVVHPVPKFPGWDVRGCAAGRVVADQFSCGRSTSRRASVAAGSAAVAAERAALVGVAGARGVSFTTELCTRTECATDRGGTWLYHDGDHLSIEGSLLLVPRFREVFASMLAAPGAPPGP